MARRWVGCMWFLLVCNGLANSVDGRFRSAGMFKNEYWFRVVSVPVMHETSRFRHRSHYHDPNHMETTVKWRHNTPTSSEDDEKADIVEDEKTSAGLTTTAYFRRTWQHSMWFNDMSSPNYNSCVQEHIYWCDSTVSYKLSFDFFVTSPMRGITHQQDDFIFRNVYSLV